MTEGRREDRQNNNSKRERGEVMRAGEGRQKGVQA